MDHAAVLRNFEPRRDFFVGIDSDGCVFDTMEIKHKECFIPNIVKHWGLQPVSKYVRAVAEFVNLYSKYRGINRFPGLTKVFELLGEWPEAMARRPKIPDCAKLNHYIYESGKALSNIGLKEMMAEDPDPVFARALAWSEAVNRDIDVMVEGVPPFPFVRETLEKLAGTADVIVVSATPGQALAKEWAEHEIAGYARVICGQEMGSKKEHLKLAAAGRYAPEKILMIGDAPGDLQAARSIGALFYPINPGAEEKSWERFYQEGCDRFLGSTYAGDYEAELIREFNGYLPEEPPWKKKD